MNEKLKKLLNRNLTLSAMYELRRASEFEAKRAVLEKQDFSNVENETERLNSETVRQCKLECVARDLKSCESNIDKIYDAMTELDESDWLTPLDDVKFVEKALNLCDSRKQTKLLALRYVLEGAVGSISFSVRFCEYMEEVLTDA